MISVKAGSRLVNADEAAKVLGVNKQRMYELARTVLPPGVVVRFNRQVRFDLKALQEWINDGGTAKQCPQ